VRPQVFTCAERPDLAERLGELDDPWPQFLHHDETINRHYHVMGERFPEFQIVLHDADSDAVLGRGQTIPVVWDGTVEGLPGGVDDALERSAELTAPTTLCAFAAVIGGTVRGAGLSALVIRAMGDAARRGGLDALIAPVRPTLKPRYPLTPIERYAAWRREDGLPLDPWLRVHDRLGARFLAIAERSLTVAGTVAEWESWTEMSFPDSGDYVVEGALVPVSIDRDADTGVYVEPNVWMLHPIVETHADSSS
jgi:hypothetical protein